MSDLDEVITSLRLKLAAAEEQKRRAAEVEAETKADPVKTLEDFLTRLRGDIERNSYSKSFPMAGFYDRRTVRYLEPILDMLKRIDERLNVLEAKASMSEPKRSPVRHNNDVTITL
jgi:hypothetical protein